MSIITLYKRHLKTKRPTKVRNAYLQTWWVVTKCVESPESDRVFCDIVGVLKKKPEGLKNPYRMREVVVLVSGKNARTGISFDGNASALELSPIDFNHSVFPGWD